MGQHRERVPEVRSHRELAGGPISLAPEVTDFFLEAAAGEGVTIVPLGSATRGLVWLSEKRAEELQEILDTHPHISWLQLPWAGVDAFAPVLQRIAALPGEQRPVVTSAKGAYSEPVAEHALALVLASLRELPRKAREARWQSERSGLSLFGARVVVFGAGGVAQSFIELLPPYRAHITVIRRSSAPVPGAELTVTPDAAEDVLSSADVVVVAAAATDETRHIISARELALMPDHAVLVNVARGSLVDAEALVDAVDAGTLWGAGLDVMDPEPFPDDHRIWDRHRIVITSHSADTPEMTRPLLAARIASNTQAFAAGTPMVGVVDVEAGY
ncbi:NAD(P)-dependent oxidoreductase [Pontimonas sp.]|nr:NAD(P)-dependent oxidoreductase [Pontimonas sp.]